MRLPQGASLLRACGRAGSGGWLPGVCAALTPQAGACNATGRRVPYKLCMGPGRGGSQRPPQEGGVGRHTEGRHWLMAAAWESGGRWLRHQDRNLWRSLWLKRSSSSSQARL